MKFIDCPSAAKKVSISATAVAGSKKECFLSPSSVHFSNVPEFKIPSIFSSDWVTWHVGTDFEINSFCTVEVGECFKIWVRRYFSHRTMNIVI